MHFVLKQFARIVTAGALLSVLVSPRTIFAQDQEHIVTSTDMQKAAAAASQSRQQNVDDLNRFFSSARGQQALASSHIDAQQVKSAVATLDDRELAQLATRANKAQQDFAAGRMNDHDLLIILIAIAALILIIVAVR